MNSAAQRIAFFIYFTVWKKCSGLVNMRISYYATSTSEPVATHSLEIPTLSADESAASERLASQV
jgi:hypothetical protein